MRRRRTRAASGKGAASWAEQERRQKNRRQNRYEPASNYKNAPGQICLGAFMLECKGDHLRAYFLRSGKVSEAFAMIYKSTGKARGFSSLTFEDTSVLDTVM